MAHERSWYIQEEARNGHRRHRFDFTDYNAALAAYNEYELVPDSDVERAGGRVWLCREDGSALRVSYVTKEM